MIFLHGGTICAADIAAIFMAIPAVGYCWLRIRTWWRGRRAS